MGNRTCTILERSSKVNCPLFNTLERISSVRYSLQLQKAKFDLQRRNELRTSPITVDLASTFRRKRHFHLIGTPKVNFCLSRGTHGNPKSRRLCEHAHLLCDKSLTKQTFHSNIADTPWSTLASEVRSPNTLFKGKKEKTSRDYPAYL